MKKLLISIIILALISACTTTPAAQSPTIEPTTQPIVEPTAEVAITQPPTQAPTLIPTLSNAPSLITKTIQEEIDSPKYTLDIKYPFLESGDQAGRFNTLIEEIITSQIDELVSAANENEAWRLETIPDMASGLFIDNTITLADDNVISVYLSVSPFIAGAAHPGYYSRTLNFDMKRGESLTLQDLFLAESDYLGIISAYCVNDLLKRDALAYPVGAEPTDDNYRNWNLGPAGLRITFDPYQVLPWASGTQEVVVPFSELKDIIDPQGLLALYIE